MRLVYFRMVFIESVEYSNCLIECLIGASDALLDFLLLSFICHQLCVSRFRSASKRGKKSQGKT